MTPDKMDDYYKARYAEFVADVLPYLHLLPPKTQGLVVRYYITSPLTRPTDMGQPELYGWLKRNATALRKAFAAYQTPEGT